MLLGSQSSPSGSRLKGIQELEPRIVLSHAPLDHIHVKLTITLDGQDVAIPANIGISSSGHSNPHTHADDGVFHVGEGGPAGLGNTIRLVTLDDFFDVWRERGGLGGSNPNSVFNENQILDRTVDGEHQIRMMVGGVLNDEFETYAPHDGDEIIIDYGLAASSNNWHNADEPTNINGIDGTTPLDALLVINELTLREFSNRETGKLQDMPNPSLLLDVNNDTFLSPIDALLVINALPNASAQAAMSGSAQSHETIVEPQGMVSPDTVSTSANNARMHDLAFLPQTDDDRLSDSIGFPQVDYEVTELPTEF